MKKYALLILAFLLVLALSACSLNFLNKTVNPPPEIPDQPEDIQPQEPEISSNEPEQPDTQEPDAPLPDPDKDDGGAPVEDVGEPDGEEEEKKEISISHTDVTLKAKDDTFTLSAKNLPDVYACTFTSEDPAIAAVDEKGIVTAVAPGTTKVNVHIECEEGQFDFSCIVRCSWKAEGGGESGQPGSGGGDALPTLSGFFATLQGSYEGLDAMMVIDGELLDTYYPGLSGMDVVEEVLIQETMMSMSNVAVGLVKLKADATLQDVIAVQDILQSRITTQAEGGAWYPVSCETWKNGVITSVSKCVGMFVSPEDAQSMADDFTAAFSN
jgi:hypothetical protein